MKITVVEISVIYDDVDADKAAEFVADLIDNAIGAKHDLGEAGGVAMVRVTDPEVAELSPDSLDGEVVTTRQLH